MTPDEHRLLTDLFSRIGGSSESRRDPEAEAVIADEIRRRPYAPYVMAQTVIVQEQALKGAAARIEELENLVRRLETRKNESTGSFLGGSDGDFLGRNRTSVPVAGRPVASARASRDDVWNRGMDLPPSRMPPHLGRPGARTGTGGGSFLGSALATAAGIAGGALLFQGLSHLFSDPSRAAALDPGLSGLDPATAAPRDAATPFDAPGFGDPRIHEASFDPGLDDGGFDAGGGGGEWT
jgi:hypothetical protein